MKKLITGPLNLPMSEDTARYVESLLKTLPQECQTFKRKSVLAQSTEFDANEHADISWVTTDSLDADREVILPKGLDLDRYRQNPVVLYNHDRGQPIGKCLWIKQVGNGVKAKTRYATRPQDHQGEWLPDTIFALVQQSILKGRSIGLIPLEMRGPTRDELAQHPEWKNANAIIPRGLLFEYSVVSVPCNADSLVEAVAKGIVDQATARKLGLPTKARKEQSLDVDLIVKTLDSIKLDPDRIVQKVLERMKTRGRV